MCDEGKVRNYRAHEHIAIEQSVVHLNIAQIIVQRSAGGIEIERSERK